MPNWSLRSWHRFPAAWFSRLPSLKFIAVSRGRPVNIDMNAARDAGVLVVNTPGRNASAVAEFTLGAILAETRLIRSGHESLRKGEWRGELYRADKTGRELSEMTVGVVGYGNIGTKVVRLLRAFGTKVVVYDPMSSSRPMTGMPVWSMSVSTIYCRAPMS